jgi:hypothetical protein
VPHGGQNTATMGKLGELIGKQMQGLRNQIDRSGSVVGVMWSRLEHGEGVERLRMGCPRRCRARPELGERSNAGCGLRAQEWQGETGK